MDVQKKESPIDSINLTINDDGKINIKIVHDNINTYLNTSKNKQRRLTGVIIDNIHFDLTFATFNGAYTWPFGMLEAQSFKYICIDNYIASGDNNDYQRYALYSTGVKNNEDDELINHDNIDYKTGIITFESFNEPFYSNPNTVYNKVENSIKCEEKEENGTKKYDLTYTVSYSEPSIKSVVCKKDSDGNAVTRFPLLESNKNLVPVKEKTPIQENKGSIYKGETKNIINNGNVILIASK